MIALRGRDIVRSAVLALVVYVVSHDAIFLITHPASYAAVLAETGHGDRWTSTVIVTALLGAALGVAGIGRLVQLARLARALGGERIRVGSRGRARFVGRLVRSWAVIFPVAMALFVVGENVEHLGAGLPAPGLTVLGSIQYEGTVAVFAIVSLIGALVDALYAWRHDVLVARIAAARAGLRRSARSSARPDLPWVERRHGSIVANLGAGRAPPVALAA
jgi:hypothetical protein